MSYARFKREVILRAGWQCQNPNCDSSDNLTIHHYLKQSVYPQFAEDSDNGMCVCGPCHSEIERRQRGGEDFLEMYSIGSYRHMLAKAGIEVPEGMDVSSRARKGISLKSRANEIAFGQNMLDLC